MNREELAAGVYHYRIVLKGTNDIYTTSKSLIIVD
jgi:hypothetical protein